MSYLIEGSIIALGKMVIQINEVSELTEPLLWGEADECPRKPERHAELIKKINAKNAKYVAFSLVLGFILYHGIIHLRYGKLAKATI